MTSFIGLGDLASFMGVATASLNTALADLATQAAQNRVRRYLDQEVTLVSNDIVYLDGNGRYKIRLPERPVRSVSLVEEGSGDPVWIALASDAYHLRDSILIRWDGARWTPGQANVRVTYTHGYDVGSIDSDWSDSDFDAQHVPADLSLATLSLARRMYENLGSESGSGSLGDIKQETIGSYSVTYADDLLKSSGVDFIFAERAVLDSYRMNGWTAH